MGLKGKLESWLWRKKTDVEEDQEQNLPEDTGRESEVSLWGPWEVEIIASLIWEGVSLWIPQALRWAFWFLDRYKKHQFSYIIPITLSLNAYSDSYFTCFLPRWCLIFRILQRPGASAWGRGRPDSASLEGLVPHAGPSCTLHAP